MRAANAISLIAIVLAGCAGSWSGPNETRIIQGDERGALVRHWTENWAARESYERARGRHLAAAHCAKYGKKTHYLAESYPDGFFEETYFLCITDDWIVNRFAFYERGRYPAAISACSGSKSEINKEFWDCVQAVKIRLDAEDARARLPASTVTQAPIPAPAATRQTRADTLQGLAEMINGLQMMMDPASAVTPRRTPSVPPRSTQGSFCPKASESVSGMFKTCVYRCPGGQVSTSIGATELCPLSIRR